MGRILALDYGTKRTGIAVSDPARIIATPLETVPTHTLDDFLAKYIASQDVDIIVVGEPRQDDGSPSATYPHTVGLIRKLKKNYPAIRVDSYDERYTSVLAQRAMIEGGASRSARQDKGLADRISAAIILQGYMENKKDEL